MGDRALVDAVLDDYTTAPVREPLRAALGMLRKFTLTPDDLTPNDMKSLLDQGLSREAITDVMYVGYVFAIYTRAADAFGWEVPSSEAVHAIGRMLHRRGYG